MGNQAESLRHLHHKLCCAKLALVEGAVKIADALDISLDYLVGKTKMALDADALRRLEDIAALSDENKKFVLNMIDMALRDFKTKKAYAK